MAKGYTKHYYAGTDLCASREQSQACLSYAETKQSVRSNRVAARLGGGGLNALHHVIENDGELKAKADILFKQSLEQVNSRVLNENDLECIMRNRFARAEFGYRIDETPYQTKADISFDHRLFKEMAYLMVDDPVNVAENDVYFYHSDHLGSASWITDSAGIAVQHLQYLPYGEPYINQHPYGYSERFTFTGKEKDEETGYGYFGARYMDHELMAMWLSVDPMVDKYPGISPYNYCNWNPVILIDPDGRDWYKTEDGSICYTKQYTSKERFLKSGIKGTYLGKTKTIGDTYYSLFGEKLDVNTINGQITMKIDDALIKYAELCIAASECSPYDPDPQHPYTDFRISSLGPDKGFARVNDHWPEEMGTYANGMADIYYFVNESKKFMEARFESWDPCTNISGRNGNRSTPSRKGPNGYQKTYLTFRNVNSKDRGVVAGLDFRSETKLNLFKNKFCELFPGLKL